MSFARHPQSHLGHTRTRVTPNHAFLAPDGHVETSLPGWRGGMLTLLLSPQMGARHTHYLARFERGGAAGAPLPEVERFAFVLEGELLATVADETHELGPKGFIYLPAGEPHALKAKAAARISVFERRYLALAGVDRPPVVVGNEVEVTGEPFLGDERILAKKLLPDEVRFDMAANTMTFEPGASLPFAETHVMEHGMLMLSGEGVYRLGDDWYPIQAGDALWMGPYCPQWFGALGREPSSYLLYKEANRDAFALERGS